RIDSLCLSIEEFEKAVTSKNNSIEVVLQICTLVPSIIELNQDETMQ
ncbi:hypothetical protein CDAR_94481, partial [Caerostris darwini]